MKTYKIRFRTVADDSHSGWERKSLPIGCGRMGMCAFGRTDTERLQFNEISLWSGGPSPKRPDYCGGNLPKYAEMQQLRAALARGDIKAAHRLRQNLVGSKDGYGAFQNFGDIYIQLKHKGVTDYVRELDISNAVLQTSYNAEGVHYTREQFASFPADVIASSFTADSRSLNMSIRWSFAHPAEVRAEDGLLCAFGRVEDNALRYAAFLGVVTDGECAMHDDTANINGASYVRLYLSCGTDYANVYPKYRGELRTESLRGSVQTAMSRDWAELRAEHIADYTRLFDRVSIDLCGEDTGLTTRELLEKYRSSHADSNARYLEELIYGYGRYLIIGSSRDGSLPANLQGVWNDENDPMWGSDYHLNVNLQMCYWHTMVTNLPECALPMLRYVESLRVPGRVTAAMYNGVVSTAEAPENGWVAHVQNTPFGWTCAGWDFDWGWSPASSTWMLQNTYQYYKYTGDEDTLRTLIYPAMRENVLFWMQNLVWNEEQKRYVSTPSYSPEHGPISVGNAYEQTLIEQLFRDTAEAAQIVGDDEEFIQKLRDVGSKLNPVGIGRWGQIREWYEEDSWYKLPRFRKLKYLRHGVQYCHRHCSHLLGLYPGDYFFGRDDLKAAAEVSLYDRGAGGLGLNVSGWSKCFKALLWARLSRGENAHTLLRSQIEKNMGENLWDLHPPYQMDGNCGYTAAVTEMLLQTECGVVRLLPALPRDWRTGSVHGIIATGGYVVDISWHDGMVTEFSYSGGATDTLQVETGGKTFTAQRGVTVTDI